MVVATIINHRPLSVGYKGGIKFFSKLIMKKTNNQFMDLNHETAMRLWNKSFGKDLKVIDFAGRQIAKCAYNDRNSDYGWNVDHILPQSKGGATADYNLICCHIKTNDEKADSFPVFKANEKSFEIVKVQNHYEIRNKSGNENEAEVEGDNINFFDSGAGIQFIDNLYDVELEERYVDSAFIFLQSLDDSYTLPKFIEKLFENYNVSFSKDTTFYYLNNFIVEIHNYDSPSTDDSQYFLDNLILLNTYLKCYFMPLETISNYKIICREDCYDEDNNIYNSIKQTDDNVKRTIQARDFWSNAIEINDTIIKNTDAKKKVSPSISEYTFYDYYYTKLAKDLEKEASRK